MPAPMHSETEPGKEPGVEKAKVEPDYDDLPRGEFNPMWEIVIAIGILFTAFAAIIAFT